MAKVTSDDLQWIAKKAQLHGYGGKFQELGGGEVNDSFKLQCQGDSVVVRVARYSDQHTLIQEAHALQRLDMRGVPKLIFFDEKVKLHGRLWVVEECLPGHPVRQLSLEHFTNLGKLLARVHRVQAPEPFHIDLWGQLLFNCKRFGDEEKLLNHPDKEMRTIFRRAKQYFADRQSLVDTVVPALLHSDATPSNTLVDGDNVALIDWEFARYGDPLNDFATMFYEDIEYNQGKWRIQITPKEKSSLLGGYAEAGGIIDEARMALWMVHDKLGAAAFLYWRLYETDRENGGTSPDQYRRDFFAIRASLERALNI